MTITIQIGNSDDKLTQKEWSFFVTDLRQFVNGWAEQVHFFGFSTPDAQWQNACVVLNLRDWKRDGWDSLDQQITAGMYSGLRDLLKRYKQDSIAFTSGDTTFVALED